MDLSRACVLLDAGHGNNTPGKCSPDKRLLEYLWCREEVVRISEGLRSLGIDTRIIVPENNDVPLKTRVARVNKIYADLGKNKKDKYVFLISVHINAAGNSGWHDATGFTEWIAPNASAASKKLAQDLYAQVEILDLKGNRYVPKEKYWTANYYIVKNTNCPAVLTENLFQDNKKDVDYLLSEEGKQVLAKLHIDGIVKFISELQ